MRVVDVPPTLVPGAPDLDAALRLVFGPDTLKKVHGPDTVVGDFSNDGRRKFDFVVDVGAVPAAIRRFFCGSSLRVTTRQTLSKTPAAWTVVNKLKMRFVGAELFGIRPRFVLTRGGDGAVRLGGRVEHYALLPPPLDGVAEGFMAATTREQLEAYARAIRAAAEPET